MKRKLSALIMAAVMVTAIAVPTSFSCAATTSDEESAVLDGMTVEGVTEEELDQESVMGSSIDENTEGFGDDESDMQTMSSSKAWMKKSAGVYYNGYGSGTLSGAVAKGIDVSKWQGTIDWSKAKADGIEFAIIRMGWGGNYTSQDDAKLAYNVAQCEKYGIPYGFYLYSYANTAAKNESEIAHVKRLLSGTHPTYPVYYDMEDSSTQGKCSYATIRSYALNFCKQIKAAGYTPGVYASLSWWKTKLLTADLDSYERWVAQWNSTGCTYTRTWKLWQCADNFYVSGISGRVDLNFAYKTFSSSTSTGSTTATTETTSSTSSSSSTSGKTTGWVTDNGSKYYYNSSGTLQKSKWLTVSGKKYYATSTGAIYMNAYKKIGYYYYGFDADGAMYTSTTATFNNKTYAFGANGRSYLCKVTTKARLNYRTGAGKSYKVKGVFKKGKALYIVRKSGSWWQTSGGYWVHKTYVKVSKTYPY